MNVKLSRLVFERLVMVVVNRKNINKNYYVIIGRLDETQC